MPYNPNMHNRRSIRLKNYDYSQTGAYFITICANQRECLFGKIANGVMVLNEAGQTIESVWCGLPKHFAIINLDEYMIMPNHFHGILYINGYTGPVGAKQDSPALPGCKKHDSPALPGCKKQDSPALPGCKKHDSPALPDFENITQKGAVAIKGKADKSLALPLRGSAPGSLGSIVQNFKSVSTRKINRLLNKPGCSVWQRNYYERVIRNENELFRAREYIVMNPLKWEQDTENPIRVKQQRSDHCRFDG